MVTVPSTDLTAGLSQTASLMDEGQGLMHRMHQLAEELRQVVAQLGQGVPAPAEAAQGLTQTAQAFEDWWRRAQKLVGGDLERSVPKVMQALEVHQQRLEMEIQRQKAMAVLEQVGSLSYVNKDEFMPLSEIQFEAIGMLRALKGAEQLDETAMALAAGTHPYALLVRLVTNPELSDSDWQEIYQAVRQSLGNELAVAAARGKLHLEA
ncbi:MULTISPECIES: hypothetical protein [unclassified Meiothermus]|uniref:hypothetical protein n=1 Tax=unclassified Meiothermus TaxID=370471 RepID=UPI0010200C48|nr:MULTISPECIES: hypothetical protein [unclassified Meiothermus]RYM33168.1 hypothetical protein EWH23_13535 [Meiothermus sp. PNK-Is4]